MNFDSQYSLYQKTFEEFLNQKISNFVAQSADYHKTQLHGLSLLKEHIEFDSKKSQNFSKQIQKFQEAIQYSLLGEGKRFRPVLCLAIADLLGGKDNYKKVLPLALAIEMIHTYSLIHDDLPCMDNDDMRRGKPTNHKVYGESTALLAGDALLTDSFKILSDNSVNAQNTLRAISLLSECAGTFGMIGGQVVDLATQKNKVSVEELSQMQINKTGALMRASIVLSAILCDASESQIKTLEEFSKYIGLNFQIADDILDKDKNELGSFVGILGLEKTKILLDNLTQKSQDVLKDFNNTEFLNALSEYNSKRLK